MSPLLIAFALSSVASASEPVKARSYGWQIAAADGATLAVSVGLAIPATQNENDIRWAIAAGAIGGAGYLFAAPAVHLANGNSKGAGRSLGTRILMPLASALVWGLGAYAVTSSCNGRTGESREHCDNNSMLISFTIGAWGGIGGAIAASIMDATWYARVEPSPASASWQVMPSIGADRVGLTFSAGL